MSSVDPSKTNEAGGLQGTAQNLGASLGTALIGSVLIAALTSGVVARVEQNPAVPPPVRETVAEIAERGIPVVPVADVEQAAVDEGVPPDQAAALADDYGDAQLDGLKARSARSLCSPCSRSGSRGDFRESPSAGGALRVRPPGTPAPDQRRCVTMAAGAT